MKLAPVQKAIASIEKSEQIVVHTGQHYDVNMSDVFFQQLRVKPPEINLQVGSGSHAKQTAEIMLRVEQVVLDHGPDMVLVYGDVNSTVAAALVCAKLLVPLAHVEAGLRSRDRSMPEEINRLMTDQLSDLLFTPSIDANLNLEREGISKSRIHLVGNVMIDTLITMLPAAQSFLPPDLPSHFALVTLHRASNVDDLEWLKRMVQVLEHIGKDLAVIFPVHPRTRQRMHDVGINGTSSALKLVDPLPYLPFLALQQRATVVVTDSGGIQEETTFLGVPCLTVRENTERPITVEMGTNKLVGRDPRRILNEVQAVINGRAKQGHIPPLWDGHSAERIAEVITQYG